MMLIDYINGIVLQKSCKTGENYKCIPASSSALVPASLPAPVPMKLQ